MAKRRQQRTNGGAGAQSGSAAPRTPSGQTTRAGGTNIVREQKRAQFTGEANVRRSRLPLVIAAAATLAIVAVVGAFLLTRGGGSSSAEFTQAASGAQGSVEIPLTEVADGKAHFYTYESGGTKVNYFVVKSPDGEVRAAFDACDVCYPYKKGYTQVGDAMQCNNCGRTFDSNQINVQEGGCNPAPLERTVQGDKLVIAPTDLEAGARYFL